MTAKTSRIVIKTFIKTALKDSDESPERCTRNLVDMALNFANGRFQQSFFEISRAILNNENSPYYPLIEDVLKHMDKEKLIDFGLNIGYNGCTTGAHMIRKLKRTENINVPWLISMMADTSRPDFFTDYQSVLDQGRELGIYTYFINVKENPEKLLPLIQNNPDCAIIFLCDASEVTEELAEKAEALNNLLFAVSYDDTAEAACLVLRDHHLLYSLFWLYSEKDSSEILSGTYFRFAEEMHCPFAAVLSNMNCSEETRRSVYNTVTDSRNSQLYRTIPLDLFYDTEKVGNIISSPTSVVGFDISGTLYTPGRTPLKTSYNFFQQPLKELFTKALAK